MAKLDLRQGVNGKTNCKIVEDGASFTLEGVANTEQEALDLLREMDAVIVKGAKWSGQKLTGKPRSEFHGEELADFIESGEPIDTATRETVSA